MLLLLLQHQLPPLLLVLHFYEFLNDTLSHLDFLFLNFRVFQAIILFLQAFNLEFLLLVVACESLDLIHVEFFHLFSDLLAFGQGRLQSLFLLLEGVHLLLVGFLRSENLYLSLVNCV